MSSGTNYPTALDLWVNKAAGDDFSPTELNQMRSAIEQIERKNFPTVGSTGELTVFSTITESNLFTVNVPANSLGTQGCLEGSAGLLINSILNAATLQLKFYFGGTNFWQPIITNAAGVTAGNLGVAITFRIHNRNFTNIQGVLATAQVPAMPQGLRFNAINSNSDCNVTGLAKDTTLLQTFAINAVWSSASASNSVTALGLYAKGRSVL